MVQTEWSRDSTCARALHRSSFGWPLLLLLLIYCSFSLASIIVSSNAPSSQQTYVRNALLCVYESEIRLNSSLIFSVAHWIEYFECTLHSFFVLISFARLLVGYLFVFSAFLMVGDLIQLAIIWCIHTHTRKDIIRCIERLYLVCCMKPCISSVCVRVRIHVALSMVANFEQVCIYKTKEEQNHQQQQSVYTAIDKY